MSITRVAELAGVSTATVSRVLNNRRIVAGDTVKKVEEAIRVAGYNALPVAERRGPKSMVHVPLRYRSFAYIWTGRAETGMKTEELAQTRTGHQLLEGASAALRKLRISLVVDYLSEPGYVPPLVEEQRLDGLLLQGTEPAPAIAEKLRRFP